MFDVDLFAAEKKPCKLGTVDVFLKPWTLEQLASFMQSAQQFKNDMPFDPVAYQQHVCRVVSWSLIDASGAPIFTEDEVETRVPGVVAEQIFLAAVKQNQVSNTAVDAAAKNSPTTPS